MAGNYYFMYLIIYYDVKKIADFIYNRFCNDSKTGHVI